MTKDIDLDALQALAEKAGSDEWSTDTIKNEGEYGAGEDAVSGFDSFAVIDSKGNTLLDTLNFDQSEIQEEYDDDYFRAWDEPAQRVAEFVAAANPQAILSLIARIRELEGDTGKSAEAIPAVLFDGYAVYQALTEKARARTSADNVADVLDAIVGLLRAAPEGDDRNWQLREGDPFSATKSTAQGKEGKE